MEGRGAERVTAAIRPLAPLRRVETSGADWKRRQRNSRIAVPAAATCQRRLSDEAGFDTMVSQGE
jgi:hypothetical protein